MKTCAGLVFAAAACSLLLAGCVHQTAATQQAGHPGDASRPAGEPVLEHPTLRSLGVYWIIEGDDNKNATVSLQYRKAGAPLWSSGPNLFRVEKGANDMNAPSERQEHTSLPIPKDSWLFAGSALLLEPDTAYEIKVTLKDPDGGGAEKILKGPFTHTIGEPVAPKDLTIFHIVPGNGGGTGTGSDPFKGLAAADAAAKPGSLMLIHPGTYPPVVLTHSGEKGRPIIYRAADEGLGQPVIHGLGTEQTARGIDASSTHDIWLEKIAIDNAHNGIVLADCQRMVIRRCKISNIVYGINGASNKSKSNEGFFISDNTILGPSTWPRTKGIEEARGMQMAGRGHDVCYNFVKGFADGIDTYQGPVCEAIDFHNNEIELCTDDGSEMDYSERNTRNYENRYTNTFQGISLQPIFGGPVYVFRNVIYNIDIEPLKIHNSPSGVLIFHNTFVKNGTPSVVMTPAEMHNFVSRNNLYVGAGDGAAFNLSLGKIVDSDWDYDGVAGGPWANFLQWMSGPQNRFTLEQVRKSGPAEKHATVIEHPETLFASGAKIPADKNVEQKPQDLRLASHAEAVDAGIPLPGLDDGYKGNAPDLGAYELGEELPHYGPRPE
jgi:hypothetical protein